MHGRKTDNINSFTKPSTDEVVLIGAKQKWNSGKTVTALACPLSTIVDDDEVLFQYKDKIH